MFYNVYNNSGICLPGVTKNVYSNLVAREGVDKRQNSTPVRDLE